MKRITAVHPDGTTNTSFNGNVGPIHFQNGVVELSTDEHDAYVAYCAVNVQFKVEHEADAPEGPADSGELKGKALDEALDEALDAAGLAKDGKVAEKRARLAEHQAAKEAEAAALADAEREADEQAAASRPETVPDLPAGDGPADGDPSGESDN